MKSVAIPVVVKVDNDGVTWVHTQTRRVINKDYDPMYHGTQETCGETVYDYEDIITAAIRGCREELGCPDLIPEKVIGADGEFFSTRSEDKILGLKPYYLVQQLKGPQPWMGLGFIVVISPDIEFHLDNDGEVSAHRWWRPIELLKNLQEKPDNFMGLHYPILIKVCQDFMEGKIHVS
ncbi:MAG: NUDIX hydrolase [Parcubacteria group bacterium]|nr:NUDIX hydrolase [Parcubacteria group bacterium]